MIEREFVKEKIRSMNMAEKIEEEIRKTAGIGKIEIEKNPLGEIITITAVRPGQVIGARG